jgi:hypothetical protein
MFMSKSFESRYANSPGCEDKGTGQMGTLLVTASTPEVGQYGVRRDQQLGNIGYDSGSDGVRMPWSTMLPRIKPRIQQRYGSQFSWNTTLAAPSYLHLTYK